MSDYTPSTTEVRQQFSREEPPRFWTVNEKNQQFNRWLAQHDAEVRAQERERIAEAFQAGPFTLMRHEAIRLARNGGGRDDR